MPPNTGRAAATGLLLGLLPACGDADEHDSAAETGDPCAGEGAAPSVLVHVVDADGAPTTPTAVRYTVDGGAALAADCWSADCTDWNAGVEVDGAFVVTAEDDGGLCVSASTTVTRGTCHVDTQELTLSFADAAPCG